METVAKVSPFDSFFFAILEAESGEKVSEQALSMTSNDSHLAVTKDECDEIIPSWDSWSKRGDFFLL